MAYREEEDAVKGMAIAKQRHEANTFPHLLSDGEWPEYDEKEDIYAEHS